MAAGFGLYRRGRVWWWRMRVPARHEKNFGKSSIRLSTRTTLLDEARTRVSLLRVAAHRGLAAIEEEAASDVPTPAENMAILKALVRDTLAEAERARAAAVGRTEADIATAIDRHRRAREEMRCALRHNEVSTVYPKLAQAAEAEAIRLDPDDARLPMLCPEAAQALIAVADENIAREDGVYAECGRRFAGLITEAGAPGAWMSDATMPGAAACAPPPPEAALATPPVPGLSPDPSPDPGPMASVCAPSRSAHGADPAERTAPRVADTAPARGPGSAGVPAAPARDAGAGGVDAQADSWGLPIDAAFQLMLDDKLANDADGAWRRGSLRQFTATRRLCNEFFGERPSGEITPAMLKDWIEALQRLPASHGKSPKHPPFHEHCALAE